MNKNYAKDLFQLQSELIDAKVDMAVSKSIDRVVEQIVDLKGQIVDLKVQMNTQFSHLEGRFSTIEHRVDNNDKALNSITNLLDELRSKVIAYSFRGGWVILAGVVLILVSQLTQMLHFFIK